MIQFFLYACLVMVISQLLWHFGLALCNLAFRLLLLTGHLVMTICSITWLFLAALVQFLMSLKITIEPQDQQQDLPVGWIRILQVRLPRWLEKRLA
jgi:hypothetical protein